MTPTPTGHRIRVKKSGGFWHVSETPEAVAVKFVTLELALRWASDAKFRLLWAPTYGVAKRNPAQPGKLTGNFNVFWSAEDAEWGATHSYAPSMSYFAGTPQKALAGLLVLIRQEMKVEP